MPDFHCQHIDRPSERIATGLFVTLGLAVWAVFILMFFWSSHA